LIGQGLCDTSDADGRYAISASAVSLPGRTADTPADRVSLRGRALHFALDKRQRVSIVLLSVRGERVRLLCDCLWDAGQHSLALPESDLSCQTRILRFRSAESTVHVRITPGHHGERVTAVSQRSVPAAGAAKRTAAVDSLHITQRYHGTVRVGVTDLVDTIDIMMTQPLDLRVYMLVNDHRAGMGLDDLLWHDVIAEQAQAHSEVLAATDTIHHDGFTDRVAVIGQSITFVPNPVDGNYAGENVGYNLSQTDPAATALSWWLGSGPHRENIERDYDFTGVGVGENGGRYYFTQIFIRGVER
jgi:uncharacterized protein YkwD